MNSDNLVEIDKLRFYRKNLNDLEYHQVKIHVNIFISNSEDLITQYMRTSYCQQFICVLKLSVLFAHELCQVCWHPWGDESDLPIYIKKSISPTRKRILLHGPQGAAWYLGERVTVQSLRSNGNLIPKSPPISMLMKDRVIINSDEWVEEGQSAYDLVVYKKDNQKKISPPKFLTPRRINYIQVGRFTLQKCKSI